MSKKVLFVCKDGGDKSGTAMHLMNRMYGYNTRCCGDREDSLIPLSDNLVYWADEIVVVDNSNITGVDKVLDIQGDYEYMDDELCSLIQRRYFA